MRHQEDGGRPVKVGGNWISKRAKQRIESEQLAFAVTCLKCSARSFVGQRKRFETVPCDILSCTLNVWNTITFHNRCLLASSAVCAFPIIFLYCFVCLPVWLMLFYVCVQYIVFASSAPSFLFVLHLRLLSDAWMIVSPCLPDCFVFVFVCRICLCVFGLCS